MLSSVAFRKTSLIDFPGRVASVLFLPGCDFRCPYCHNAGLVLPGSAGDGGPAGEGMVPLAEFLAHLDRRKSLISGVVVSGGEPLMHDEAPRLARAIRDRGLAVKLDTNGSFPDRILAFGADYVALDVKTAPSAYDRVAPGLSDAGERLLESIRVLRGSGAGYELRLTCAPGIVGPDEIEEIADLLRPGDPVVLQGFRPGGCLDPAWDRVEPYAAGDMELFLARIRSRAPLARLRGAA